MREDDTLPEGWKGPVLWGEFTFPVRTQKDREEGEDDSHQVKHWKLDHPEFEAPPVFKFKMLSSFQDPLTRQLAESVRIEREGSQILNSRSEYSRCRVPRLMLTQQAHWW